MTAHDKVVGVILAGGLGRRMGDLGRNGKALLKLEGEPILARTIDLLRPQVGSVMINANGDPADFEQFGLPVVGDSVEGFAGPLAGVLAGLDWAAVSAPDADWVVTVACDTPFFPCDLVERLLQQAISEKADLACAASGGRHHPVFGLWPVRLREELRTALMCEKVRKVDIWTAGYKLAVAKFATSPYDPFFNVNRSDDLLEAERLLREISA